jgi:nickel/cobalt exporter
MNMFYIMKFSLHPGIHHKTRETVMTNVLMMYYPLAIGAAHAFEPGHGKTLIAAYMIGTKGRVRDGFLLGAIVTFTHTFSVILLGLIANILSKTYSYSDASLHNWLGLLSAGIILAVGIWMLRQRLSGNAAHHHFHLFGKGHNHEHHHPHEHQHVHDSHHEHHRPHNHRHDIGNTNEQLHEHTHEHHHPHEHPHVHDNYHEHPHHDHDGKDEKKEEKNKWQLLMLGISGGIIPCPLAITLLLHAIGSGNISQALNAALLFSLGLGIVMMTIGVVMSLAGNLLDKISDNMKFVKFSQRIGLASATLIIFIGSYTMFHSVKNIWF